jgi:hypothetical protein
MGAMSMNLDRTLDLSRDRRKAARLIRPIALNRRADVLRLVMTESFDRPTF